MAVFLVTVLLWADDFGVPPRGPHISGFWGCRECLFSDRHITRLRAEVTQWFTHRVTRWVTRVTQFTRLRVYAGYARNLATKYGNGQGMWVGLAQLFEDRGKYAGHLKKVPCPPVNPGSRQSDFRVRDG